MQFFFVFMASIIFVAPGVAHSNTLKGVLVPDRAVIGTSLEVVVTFNEPDDRIGCGLVVNWGDGEIQKLRVGLEHQLKPPYKIQHTYKTPGQFSPMVTGELMIRGLRTVPGCEGKFSSVVNVSSIESGSASSPPAPSQVDKPIASTREKLGAEETAQIAAPITQKPTPSVPALNVESRANSPANITTDRLNKAVADGKYMECERILHAIMPVTSSGARILHPNVGNEVTFTTEDDLLKYIEDRKNKVCDARNYHPNNDRRIESIAILGYVDLSLVQRSVQSCFINNENIPPLNSEGIAVQRCKETTARDWINFGSNRAGSSKQNEGRVRYETFLPYLEKNVVRASAKLKRDEMSGNYEKAAMQDRDLDIKGFRIGAPLNSFTSDNYYSCITYSSDIAECQIKHNTTCKKTFSKDQVDLFAGSKQSRLVYENAQQCVHTPSQPNSPWATIAGAPIDASSVRLRFLNGKLIRLEMNIYNSSSLVNAALKEKYGPPPTEDSIWPAKNKLLKMEFFRDSSSARIILANEAEVPKWEAKLLESKRVREKSALQDRERKQSEDIRLRAKDL